MVRFYYITIFHCCQTYPHQLHEWSRWRGHLGWLHFEEGVALIAVSSQSAKHIPLCIPGRQP